MQDIEKKIKIVLPDGSDYQVLENSSLQEVVNNFSKSLAKKTIAAKINGHLVDLIETVNENDNVLFVTIDSEEGREILKHSTSHIMAQAVLELFPGTHYAIGPAIENGFYYDFEKEKPFSEKDLDKIEQKMREIINKKYNFSRMVWDPEKAICFFKELDERYKIELIEEHKSENISLYKQGSFTDLCRGPHVPNTSFIKHFKLLSNAGAYWRGDEKNIMLQRIYGCVFPKKKELSEFLERLEEAKRRDHRKLGKELDLYSTHNDGGSGLIYWHPKGALIRHFIESFWKDEHLKSGYEILYSPHIGKAKLWETSGHLEFYQENMYSPIQIEGQDYYLKPMNCPFHILMYNSNLHSYRELPFRWAELGTVYRYERSGVLHGLLRVRGFTQDDAHIICSPDQVEDEIDRVLEFSLHILKSFGFSKYNIYLSTRPEKFVGLVDRWEKAQDSLKNSLIKHDLPFQVDEGEGTFYGPKIDIKIKDSLDREWQCSTIQFDFNLPERFDMSFIGKDGSAQRPYMIHRALLGSLERFFGILIEHYAGAFPLWLSPEQVRILPITDEQIDYSNKIKNELTELGFRVKLDNTNEKIGYKIRNAQLEKIPFMVIIGKKEVENNSISVRSRKDGDLGRFLNIDFIKLLNEFLELKK